MHRSLKQARLTLPAMPLLWPTLQLRVALEEPGGKLPGFMRMCDCLVRSSEGQEGADKAHFAGMILEKLTGEKGARQDERRWHGWQ